jgi:thiol:disulfide interchange protein
MIRLIFVVLAVAQPAAWAGEDEHCRAAYQEFKTRRPVFVFITAPWCMVCRVWESRVLPTLKSQQSVGNLEIVKVDQTENAARWQKLAAAQNGVISLPQFLLMYRGEHGVVCRRLFGYQTPEDLEKFLRLGTEKHK